MTTRDVAEVLIGVAVQHMGLHGPEGDVLDYKIRAAHQAYSVYVTACGRWKGIPEPLCLPMNSVFEIRDRMRGL